MSPEEKSFLQWMDRVARLQECWIATGFLTTDLIPASARSTNPVSCDTVATQTTHMLQYAGRILGLSTRWHVTATQNPRALYFHPKNGQSLRMLQRYETLYMEREMSDGY